MNNKRFLLTAINSKYIHSNLAVYCLKAAAGAYEDSIDIAEYTINNQPEDILRGIFKHHPDYIGISCYIWNISMVKEIIAELGKILPEVPIWLGGPEVSYNARYYVEKYPNVAGVMKGEGEYIFSNLISCYMENRKADIVNIPGIVLNNNGVIVDNECPAPIDMSNMKMPYNTAEYNPDTYRNKIIYYESSRGCPFSCSYCLSSVDKRLRFRDTKMVTKDLQFFIDNEVSQVKFVDRTFNCQKEHAVAIWKYINEHDKGTTNFHFEIAADILDDEEIRILNSMRPGLVQLEIGVQSTNSDTIKAIHRHMDLKILADNVKKIHSAHNIHMHLDLIAGLPYEDFESFGKSFDDIYNMKPDQLQLGFLKLLHGSLMREEMDSYGIVGRDTPPYEVLFTKWLSYEDINRLKMVENVTDMFYNSGMFVTSLEYIISLWKSPFDFYLQFGEFYMDKYSDGSLPSRNGKYELLFEFSKLHIQERQLHIMKELLKFDMLCRDNVKAMPYFLAEDKLKTKKAREYFEGRKITKAEHIEIFDIDVCQYGIDGIILDKETVVHFNYLEREPLSNNALIKTL